MENSMMCIALLVANALEDWLDVLICALSSLLIVCQDNTQSQFLPQRVNAVRLNVVSPTVQSFAVILCWSQAKMATLSVVRVMLVVLSMVNGSAVLVMDELSLVLVLNKDLSAKLVNAVILSSSLVSSVIRSASRAQLAAPLTANGSAVLETDTPSLALVFLKDLLAKLVLPVKERDRPVEDLLIFNVLLHHTVWIIPMITVILKLVVVIAVVFATVLFT
jgi:hypothetical protein